jgi:hypothetical protein
VHVPVTLLQLVPWLVLEHEAEPGHELEPEPGPGPGPEVAGHIQIHSGFRNCSKYLFNKC